MQLIGFSQPATAHLLANYLKRQHIKVSVVHDAERGHILHLDDESQVDTAKSLIADFLRNPSDSKYQDAAWQQDDIAFTASSGATNQFGLAMSGLARVPVVALLLVICSVLFISAYLGLFPAIANGLMIQPLSTLAENGQWWRVFTPALLHFSELHIVFNLLWWWVLGRQLESKFGSVFLALFFLITAAFSNLAQLLVTGPNFGGLSGVVYALMGFVWWIGWLRPQWGISLPKPLIGFMLIWLVLGYADVLWVSMANTAHSAGLIAGCLLALVITKLKAPAR